MSRMVGLFLFFLVACNQEKVAENQKKDSVNDAKNSNPIAIKQKNINDKNKVLTDTITFLEFDDNGDYPLLFAKKANKRITFIYNLPGKLNFVRDDQLVVKWKMDSTWIAGEGEKLEMREWIIAASKIKDGSVSLYRKKHHKPIKYWHANDDNYSDSFKDYLYTLVEYYLANTKNELVLMNLKANTDLVYAIEDGNKNGRSYTVLGLASNAEGYSSIIVWLYLDNETRKFYEYDLASDKLIEFK